MASDRDDAFTLVEVMVVVLVIAVLLAIAIPTFLAARQRANDRAAQMNVRTAHVNEIAYYSDGNGFSDVPATMQDFDASVSWTNATADMTISPRTIYVEVFDTFNPNDTVILGDRSASGTCFWLRTVGDKDFPRFATNDCTGVPLTAAFTESW